MTARRLSLFLLLILASHLACRAARLSEIASAHLPPDVEWVLSPTSLTTSLSDVRQLRFAEVTPLGSTVRQEVFAGVPNPDTPECASYANADNPFAALKETADLTNEALSQSPDLNGGALAKLNESNIGRFELLNTQALWFARGSTRLNAAASGSVPNAVTADVEAGGARSSVLLIALVATLKFTADPSFTACTAAGYRGRPETRAAFARFAASVVPPNQARAFIYRGAVIGSLIGLTVNNVSFDTKVNAQAPPSAYDAKFSLRLTKENVSLNYQQHGVLSPAFTLGAMLETLDMDKDAMQVLSRLRAATEQMAIIGMLPEAIVP